MFKVITVILVLMCSISVSKTVKIENRIKVAIIDTGMPKGKAFDDLVKYICLGDHANYTTQDLTDSHGHSTNLSYAIADNINHKKVCIWYCKYYDTSAAYSNANNLTKCFEEAEKTNVRYVNYSGGGPAILKKEKEAIQKLLENEVRVIVAGGNESDNLWKSCHYYPACYKFEKNQELFYVVGNRLKSSNYGGPIVNIEEGQYCDWHGSCAQGTSQSTAIFTGKLIKREAIWTK